MSLTRWNPARELDEVFDRMNRFFPGALARDFGMESLTSSDWAPAVVITETPEAYLIKADLPEVKKEDCKVTLENGVLTLSGERRIEKEEKNRKHHRIERHYGRFVRRFSMPTAIDDQKVSATFRDGVLHVSVPKAPQAHAATREVKIG